MLQLEKIRKERKMTQSKLGKRLGVSPNAVSQYENHKREPNLKLLKQMSIILQCSLDELVG